MQAGDHHEELPQPGRHRPGEAVAGPEEETTRTRGKLGTLTLTIPKTIPLPWGIFLQMEAQGFLAVFRKCKDF